MKNRYNVLDIIYRDMTLRRDTLVVAEDENEFTIDVVWTTGMRGVRFDWERWDYIEEELSTDAKQVRLDRLNAGAPVLNAHSSRDLKDIIGVVVEGSARMEKGQGIATLRLVSTPDIADIVTKIRAGVIRNISVGYTVHQYDITETQGQRPLYRAVDWEPYEISFVPMPFDWKAQARTADATQGGFPCIFRRAQAPKPDRETIMDEDDIIETRRRPEIINRAVIDGDTVRTFARDAKLNAEQTLGLLEEHDAKPFTRNGAIERVLEIRASQDAPPINGRHSGAIGRMSEDRLLRGRLADALYAKLARKAPADHAREFMGASLGTMARLLLEQRGERTGMMNDRQVIERSMGGTHTTGDFPELLLGAGNRFLQDSFELARSPLLRVSKIRTVGDFREIKVLQLSGFSGLEPIGEGGEFKNGTFSEGGESYKIGTFGKIFTISRNALINDDLGAFSDPLRTMARAAAECEAQQLADLLLQGSGNGPTMADGKALFHADHGNKAASGTVIDVSNLSVARQAMRSQKEVGSNAPINAAAKYLLVGAAKETQAEQVLASLSPATIDAVNPFSGKLELLVEPRFGGNSWRLFADPTLSPVIEAAYLEGHEAPTLETRDGWRTLGAEFRVYFDFGCGAVDHRGAYLNAGA